MTIAQESVTREEKQAAFVRLGFPENSSPSEKALKKAYKKLAFKYHPDKQNPNVSEFELENVKEAFQEISHAYQVALAPVTAPAAQTTFTPWEPEDVFNEVFGSADHLESIFRRFFHVPEPTVCSFVLYRVIGNSSHFANYHFESTMQLEDFLQDEISVPPIFTKWQFSDLKISSQQLDVIISCLKESSKILEVTFPHGRLNAAQKARLRKLTAKNKRLRDREVLEKYCSLGVITGVFALSVSCHLLGFGALMLLGSLFLGAALGLFVGAFRHRYLVYARDQYQYLKKAEIMAVTPEEKNALKIGVEAGSWKGYFASIVSGSAYKRPLAFAAGMKAAMDEDARFLNKIKAIC